MSREDVPSPGAGPGPGAGEAPEPDAVTGTVPVHPPDDAHEDAGEEAGGERDS